MTSLHYINLFVPYVIHVKLNTEIKYTRRSGIAFEKSKFYRLSGRVDQLIGLKHFLIFGLSILEVVLFPVGEHTQHQINKRIRYIHIEHVHGRKCKAFLCRF